MADGFAKVWRSLEQAATEVDERRRCMVKAARVLADRLDQTNRDLRLARDELKLEEMRLKAFNERTTFARELARIFNVDRDFAKQLLALSKGQ